MKSFFLAYGILKSMELRGRYRPSGPIAADKPPGRAVSRRSFYTLSGAVSARAVSLKEAWPRQNSVKEGPAYTSPGGKMKFTAKLIAAFVLAALIPVATLGYLSYSSAKAALEKQALEDLILIADARKASSTAFFELIKGRAPDFSSDGFIRDAIEALRTPDARYPRGAELRKSLDTHLKRNKMPLDRSIRLISVVGVNGKVLASTDGRELGADESKHEYFTQGRKAFIQAMCITGTTVEHRGILIILSPQRPSLGGNRRSIGVIINYYDTLELNKILSGKFQLQKGALTSLPGTRKPQHLPREQGRASQYPLNLRRRGHEAAGRIAAGARMRCRPGR